MKKYILVFCLMLSCSLTSWAQVSFQFSDGIYNENLKARVERNVSALLTEINQAEKAGRMINLSTISMDANARNGLTSLWSNIRFRCEWKTMCSRAYRISLDMR